MYTNTPTHTHALETVYRVSRITRCYGNSRATHQRNGEREKEKRSRAARSEDRTDGLIKAGKMERERKVVVEKRRKKDGETK